MAFRWVFRRPRDYRLRRKRVSLLTVPLTMNSPVCFAAGAAYVPGFQAGEAYQPGFVTGEVYQPGFQAGDIECGCD